MLLAIRRAIGFLLAALVFAVMLIGAIAYNGRAVVLIFGGVVFVTLGILTSIYVSKQNRKEPLWEDAPLDLAIQKAAPLIAGVMLSVVNFGMGAICFVYAVN